ncbi:MAG: exodeoxyribonuclease VII large subunit, partial [Vulcanococcus sp.]
LEQRRSLLRQRIQHRLEQERLRLQGQHQRWQQLHPCQLLLHRHQHLEQRRRLLQALSPQRLLERGFAMVVGPGGRMLRSIKGLEPGQSLQLELADGRIDAVVHHLHPHTSQGTPKTHG